MEGKIATYCLVLCALVLLPDHVFGRCQMEQPPSRLVSKQALLLVESTDTASLIKKMIPNWYDPFYGPANEAGRLLPLNLPTLKTVESRRTEWEHHWLDDCFSDEQADQAILSEIQRLATILRSASEKEELAHCKSTLTQKLASLFPGKSFIAIESSHPGFRVVFGFEYDPMTFDWRKSLMSIAEKSDPLRSPKHPEDIFWLKDEKMYFFSHKNTIYGVYDTSVDYCHGLAVRVSKGAENFESLEESRYYKRIQLRFESERRLKPDLFCFARIDDLLRRLQGSSTDQVEAWILEKFTAEWLGWTNCMGIMVELGGKNLVDYRVYFPVLQPLPKFMDETFSMLESLDPEKRRRVPTGASWMSYVSLSGASKFSASHSDFMIPGSELCMKDWKKLLEDREPEANDFIKDKPDFDLALTNLLSGGYEQAVEVCRYATVLAEDEKAEFFNGRMDMEVFRGVFFQNSDFLDEEGTVKRLESLDRQLSAEVKAEDGEDQAAPISWLPSTNMRDFNLSSFGHSKPLFSIATHDGTTTIFSCKSSSAILDEAIGKGRIVGDNRESFVLKDLLCPEVSDIGEVKAIYIRRNFGASEIGWETMRPLLQFVARYHQANRFSYDFGAKIRGDANFSYDDTASQNTQLSLLNRLSKVPLLVFGDELNRVRNLPYLPLKNMSIYWTEAMIYDQENGAVEYVGSISDQRKR